MSRYLPSALLGLSLAASTLAAQRPKADTRADEAAIRRVMAAAVASHHAGDADAWLKLADNDIVMMFEGDSAIRGIDNAAKFVRNFFATTKSAIAIRAIDVHVSGDIAVVRTQDGGTFTPKAGGQPAPVDLKELVTFRRQRDGSWKVTNIAVTNNKQPNVALAAQVSQAGSSTTDALTYISADRASFVATPGAPGVSAAPVFGDADRDAPHGELITFVPGFDAAMHVHTNTTTLIVLKGAYLYRDEAGEKRVGPGELLRIPGGHKHWSGGDAKEGAVFYMHMLAKMDQTPAK